VHGLACVLHSLSAVEPGRGYNVTELTVKLIWFRSCKPRSCS